MECKKGVDKSIPYVMLVSLLLMNILLVSGIMNLFFDWDSTLISGMLGFSGAIIGGSLTLIGVKWTLDNQEKKEEKRRLSFAKFIFIEMLPHLTDVNELIKSMSYHNINESLVNLEHEALKLIHIANENYSIAIQINITFYQNMKAVEYHAKEIIDYLSRDSYKTDQQIISDLMVIRNNLARHNSKFDELIRSI